MTDLSTAGILAALAVLLAVAVYRLRRASRQVDVILQDLEDTAPAPTTSTPKENPAA